MPTLYEVIWERDLTPYLHVQLLDVDITDDLLSEQHNGIAGIELTLDYPELNVFKASNIILTLANDDGSFSPDNPTNFFIQNGDPNVVNSFKVYLIVIIFTTPHCKPNFPFGETARLWGVQSGELSL